MKKLVALVVLLLLGAGYWAGFIWAEPAAPAPWPLDLAEVRKAAHELPGDLPTEVRVEKVVHFEFPAAVLLPGKWWGSQQMTTFAYQLIFPTRTALIDTAMDEPTARSGIPVKEFDNKSWARVQRGIYGADFSVMTHEHFDHIGGVLLNPAAWEKAIVNKEQLEHPELVKPLEYPATKPKTILDYQGIKAIAPGVVLIRAPGHTPGSQLVFVQLQSGGEILFLGDVAWTQENVDRVRERPRAVTLLGSMDRDALMKQLAALNALKTSEPKLKQVPGHDAAAVDALVADGTLKEGFKFQ